MKSGKFLFLLILFFQLNPWVNGLFAQSAEEYFKKANDAYYNRQFEEAIKLYEKAAEGNPSAEIFYNLGNSWFKTGDYAKAILNYERAKKLRPDDDDLEFNLRIANAGIIDKIDPVPQVFYERWGRKFLSSYSEHEWAKFGVIALWIALLFGIAYLFSNSFVLKKISFFSILVALLFSLALLFFARQEYRVSEVRRQAVIMETSVYIKSSPEEKSTNLFMLHAGTKLEIIDELQNWKKIRLANGSVGWIPERAIEII